MLFMCNEVFELSDGADDSGRRSGADINANKNLDFVSDKSCLLDAGRMMTEADGKDEDEPVDDRGRVGCRRLVRRLPVVLQRVGGPCL